MWKIRKLLEFLHFSIRIISENRFMNRTRTFTVLSFLFFAALMLLPVKAHSLEYIDVYENLSDAFSGFVDQNSGSTSFPSLNIPCGGRAESLGSACTALADDITFFDYNPAASSVLSKTELALFHNSWIADSNLETLAATWRKNDLGMGAKIKCFYVPFTEYNDFGNRVASSYYSETTGIFNISYNFFNGYYFKGLAVGTNIKASWRSVPDYTDKTTGAIIPDSGLSQSGAAVMADLGLLLRFNFAKGFADREANLKIGFCLQNAGVAFTGFGTAQGVTIDDSLPTAISAGIAYRFIKPVTICADFRQPLNLQDFSKTEKWDAGIGVDVNITDSVELMAGFRLKGANPRISLGTEVELKKFILDFNYTFDLTSSLNPVNHFSIGARINFGDDGRKSRELQADGFYEDGLKYYAQGEMDKAVEAWEKCLKLNPAFTPARNSINLVKNSKKLFDRVIDIQSLEF